MGEDIAESGVIGADMAEGILAQLGDEIAKTVLIQEGTPLVGGEYEAGRRSLSVNTRL